MSSISSYNEFVTQKNHEFLKPINDLLEKEIFLKTYEIYLVFLAKNNTTWERYIYKKEQSNLLPRELPKTYMDWYKYLKDNFASMLNKKNEMSQQSYDECIFLNNIFEKPPNHHQVIFSIKALSESIRKKDYTALNFKESLEENANFYNECTKEKRLIKKIVLATYFKKDDMTNPLTKSFVKDYRQNCKGCAKWMTTAHKLSKCSKCLETYYCNRECQKDHWNVHKIDCKPNKSQ